MNQSKIMDTRTVLWIVLAIGLTAGFAEAGLLMWQKLRQHRMGVSTHSLWMAPFFVGTASLLIGLILSAGRHFMPRIFPPRVILFVPIALCTASVLGLTFSFLHSAAIAAIACGVGVQLSWLLTRGTSWLASAARWWSTALAGTAMVIAGYTQLRDNRTERAAIASLADAPAGAISVLLLVLDTVGAQHLSLYGYPRPTSPALEKWAKRGVTFDRAIATASWTLPSHTTMFTGLYPHEFDYDWLRPVETDKPMLAEKFRDHGYVTAAFAANWIYLPREYAIDRGFIKYEIAKSNIGTFVNQAWLSRRVLRSPTLRTIVGTDQDILRPPAAEINDRFLTWTASNAKGRPFFGFLNYFDAHKPYIPPHDVFRTVTGREKDNDLDPLAHYTYESRKNATQAQITLARDAYDAAIAAQDGDLDRLLTELERRGMLRNTLVVITADHGEEFGEHGVFYHGHTVYSSAIHVPLVMFGPGVPKGVRFGDPVSLRDVASTIIELAGLPSAATLPGSPLSRAWSTGSSSGLSPAVSETKRGVRIPDRYPTAKADAHSIVKGNLHYMRIGTGKEELFDWYADPGERHNLIGTPAGDSAAVQLRDELTRIRAGGTGR